MFAALGRSDGPRLKGTSGVSLASVLPFLRGACPFWDARADSGEAAAGGKPELGRPLPLHSASQSFFRSPGEGAGVPLA